MLGKRRVKLQPNKDKNVYLIIPDKKKIKNRNSR